MLPKEPEALSEYQLQLTKMLMLLNTQFTSYDKEKIYVVVKICALKIKKYLICYTV